MPGNSSLPERKGSFVISNNLLRSRPEAVMRLMRDILIVRAESKFELDGIEYLGFSFLFDRCSPVSGAPIYLLETNGIDFMFSKP